MMPEPEIPEQLRRAPHPMSGWVAVVPIPTPPDPEDGEDKGSEELAQSQVNVGGLLVEFLDLRSALRTQRGIEAAIVLEIGPVTDKVDEDDVKLVVPYEFHHTVYYYTDRAIRIGDFRYIRLEHVLAWEEAPV